MNIKSARTCILTLLLLALLSISSSNAKKCYSLSDDDYIAPSNDDDERHKEKHQHTNSSGSKLINTPAITTESSCAGLDSLTEECFHIHLNIHDICIYIPPFQPEKLELISHLQEEVPGATLRISSPFTDDIESRSEVVGSGNDDGSGGYNVHVHFNFHDIHIVFDKNEEGKSRPEEIASSVMAGITSVVNTARLLYTGGVALE